MKIKIIFLQLKCNIKIQPILSHHKNMAYKITTCTCNHVLEMALLH